MTHHSEENTSFPGYVNVAAINAAPDAIQSAMVYTNKPQKRAVIELGFYESVSPDRRIEAAKACRAAVLAHLGEGWTASFRKP